MMENTLVARLEILESRKSEPANGWPVAESRQAGPGALARPLAQPPGGGRQMYGPRLPKLNTRVIRLKQRQVKDRRFSEEPPSLADTICLATLEANEARPGRYIAVSHGNAEWPKVRIEQRWEGVLTAWLIFLADLVIEGDAKLEAQATRVPEARGVELLLRVRHPDVPRQPENFDCVPLAKALATMKELEGTAQLAVEPPEVSVRLYIPDGIRL